MSAVLVIVVAASPGLCPVREWLTLTDSLNTTQSHGTARYSSERVMGKHNVKTDSTPSL